ncbi:MAG: ATP-dependent DNA helicase RecG [Bdellovibrionales bacterium]
MRPAILFSLFTNLTALKGVGARMAGFFLKLCGHDRIIDLLFHLPTGIIDRSYSPSLRHAEKDHVVTLELKIIEYLFSAIVGKPHRIIGTDGSDDVALTYFTAKRDYLEHLYPLGQKVIVSGTLERFGHGWSINHPDYALPPSQKEEIPLYEPTYPLTAGLSRKKIANCLAQILPALPQLPEWHDQALMTREGWSGWQESLRKVHQPDDATSNEKPRERLAYDELLADQLALAIMRRHHKKTKGRSLRNEGKLAAQLIKALPFTLTESQKKAVADIKADMETESRMLRLLQGDVGSGKTVVALLAILHAVESGFQAALMAPTEILARQHAATLSKLLTPLGIEVGLLVGGAKNKARDEILESLANGSLKIAIGTHALFQKDIAFKNLALAVMDEQHRFGVTQRLQLADKGQGVDILVMTATPIPRTLTLTAFGDMDVSRMSEKPAGRKPVDTRLIPMTRLEEVIAGVHRQIQVGAQIYWVCPLVEESEKIDLAAATERATLLRKTFGEDKIGLVHGKLKQAEKDAVMQDFINGKIRVLVATTVIEVGVDVPNASLMIIEHSERFGLAQLHQLRGRVGRGSTKSTCLLLYQTPLGAIAQSRLKMMRETEDGFLIAEEDLRLRGPGEMLGTRQSGLPVFKIANIATDKNLLKIAHDDAKVILAQDPDLTSERGKALRILLYLFEKDAAVKLFRSG